MRVHTLALVSFSSQLHTTMAEGGEVESHMCLCDDRLWVQVQQRTFTNWVNANLKGQGLSVETLESDLADGVLLIKLLETLAPGKRMPGRCV